MSLEPGTRPPTLRQIADGCRVMRRYYAQGVAVITLSLVAACAVIYALGPFLLASPLGWCALAVLTFGIGWGTKLLASCVTGLLAARRLGCRARLELDATGDRRLSWREFLPPDA